MKTWLKYLIGIALGLIASFVLPLNSLQGTAAVEFITEIVIRVGRYLLVPLVFFSGIMAVYRLYDAKLTLKTSLWTALTIVASSLLLTILGLVSILLVRIPRIPITAERVQESVVIDIPSFIRSIIPFSVFQAFTEGSFLLPVFAFAVLVGAGCCMQHTNIKPILSLTDSLSELFFNLSAVFTDLLSIGCIAIMCNWTIQFRNVIKSGVFTPLIILLTVDFFIVVGIIYPVIIRTVCKNGKPLKPLYASIVPVIVSFFSGDSNLVLPVNMHTGKNTLGIRQRTNGFSFPLFSIFARGGTALVCVVSFLIIWRSYSTLDLNAGNMIWVAAVSFGLSFLLGNIPSGGTFIALTVLCTMYGRGMGTGYLLLKPAAVIIGSFAAAIDAVTSIFGCYIIASKTKTIEMRRI